MSKWANVVEWIYRCAIRTNDTVLQKSTVTGQWYGESIREELYVFSRGHQLVLWLRCSTSRNCMSMVKYEEHRNSLCPKTSYDGQVSQDDGECGILCVWLYVLMTMWLRGHEDGFEHTRWRHGFHLATHTYSDRHATGFQCSAFWQGEYFQTTTCTERCVCVMHMYWL